MSLIIPSAPCRRLATFSSLIGISLGVMLGGSTIIWSWNVERIADARGYMTPIRVPTKALNPTHEPQPNIQVSFGAQPPPTDSPAVREQAAYTFLREVRDNEVAVNTSKVAVIVDRSSFIAEYTQNRVLVALTYSALALTALGELFAKMAESSERAERERTESNETEKRRQIDAEAAKYSRQPEDI